MLGLIYAHNQSSMHLRPSNRVISLFPSCTVCELWPSTGPKSLYFATLLCLTPPAEGFPGTISAKFSVNVKRWPRYQIP